MTKFVMMALAAAGLTMAIGCAKQEQAPAEPAAAAPEAAPAPAAAPAPEAPAAPAAPAQQ